MLDDEQGGATAAAAPTYGEQMRDALMTMLEGEHGEEAEQRLKKDLFRVMRRRYADVQKAVAHADMHVEEEGELTLQSYVEPPAIREDMSVAELLNEHARRGRLHTTDNVPACFSEKQQSSISSAAEERTSPWTLEEDYQLMRAYQTFSNNFVMTSRKSIVSKFQSVRKSMAVSSQQHPHSSPKQNASAEQKMEMLEMVDEDDRCVAASTPPVDWKAVSAAVCTRSALECEWRYQELTRDSVEEPYRALFSF
jgi:hypothetical protein